MTESILALLAAIGITGFVFYVIWLLADIPARMVAREVRQDLQVLGDERRNQKERYVSRASKVAAGYEQGGN
jgi:hypothetical protein